MEENSEYKILDETIPFDKEDKNIIRFFMARAKLIVLRNDFTNGDKDQRNKIIEKLKNIMNNSKIVSKYDYEVKL